MRTRFAPSPTGMLHVGGLRTALYAWLVAKKNHGTFLLRIEDTDRTREVPHATENILEALHWAGLKPDEGIVLENGVVTERGGHGPYKQSDRRELYAKYAKELLEKGHAYHCFCTPERLEEMRNKQMAMKRAPMYDRQCLKLPKEEVQQRIDSGEKHVIRLRIPDNETVAFKDEIRGLVSFESHTIDDQVLMKSDGFPTYHLAHVVDDHLMEIGIVIRGEEWLSSLPKHLLLFRMLGWEPPQYAHLPLLLNKDRTKLSKRQGDVAATDYIAKGYLPEAMLNFIAFLGWNPGTTQELFSKEELIEAFTLDRVQKAGAVFDLEKLDWLQGQWMRKLPDGEFVTRCRTEVARAYPAAATDPQFEQKSMLIRERITFFHEAPEMLGYFYVDPTPTVELLANKKQKVNAEDLPQLLSTITEILEKQEQWDDQSLLASFRAATEEKQLKLGQLLWPLRAALTGREYSPGAVEVATQLGKEETLKRIHKAQSLVA